MFAEWPLCAKSGRLHAISQGLRERWSIGSSCRTSNCWCQEQGAYACSRWSHWGAHPTLPANEQRPSRSLRRRDRANSRRDAFARVPSPRIATTIMASSLAFIDGSVVNVGLPAIVGAFMRTPSACSGWSIWRRIVLWAIAVAEAADLDAFGYLNGRIAHLERRIATLESSDRCAASPKAQ